MRTSATKSEDGRAAHLVPFAHKKAGMEGVNKAHVAKVIEQASRGSSYWDEQRRKDRQTEASMANMNDSLRRMPRHEAEGHATYARKTMYHLESSRRLDRIWVVVDMDQFFAAVAIRNNPKLEKLPLAVGGMSMISTASYSARKFGVRSAMPGFIAKRLCPSLVFVRSDFDEYRKASEACKAVYRQFDSGMRAASLDEAYLDITDHCERLGIRTGVSTGGAAEAPPCDAPADQAAAIASAGSSACGPRSHGGASSAAVEPSASSSAAAAGQSTGHSGDHVKAGSTVASNQTAAVRKPGETSGSASGNGAGAARRAALASLSPLEIRRREDELPQMHDASDPSLPVERRIGAVVLDIRRRVEAATGLTCSAGAGPNPMLAKMASEENKPDGQFVVPFSARGSKQWVQGKRVREVPFVGRVTEKMLESQGVHTVADLERELPRLWGVLKPAMREALARRSIGVADAERDDEESRRKSISMERTFRAEGRPDALRVILSGLIHSLAAQMQGRKEDHSQDQAQGVQYNSATGDGMGEYAEARGNENYGIGVQQADGLEGKAGNCPASMQGEAITGPVPMPCASGPASTSGSTRSSDAAVGYKRGRSTGEAISPSGAPKKRRKEDSSSSPAGGREAGAWEYAPAAVSGASDRGSITSRLFLPTGAASSAPGGFGSADSPEDKGPRLAFRGRVLTIKLKGADFAQRQRYVQLPAHTNDARTMLRAARRLLDKEIELEAARSRGSAGQTPAAAGLRLRLMGVKMSELQFEDEAPGGTAGIETFMQPVAKSGEGVDAPASGAAPGSWSGPRMAGLGGILAKQRHSGKGAAGSHRYHGPGGASLLYQWASSSSSSSSSSPSSSSAAQGSKEGPGSSRSHVVDLLSQSQGSDAGGEGGGAVVDGGAGTGARSPRSPAAGGRIDRLLQLYHAGAGGGNKRSARSSRGSADVEEELIDLASDSESEGVASVSGGLDDIIE